MAQTLADFEIIVVDDKSTDDTIARISDFKDRRIRLVRNDVNLGMGGNWNKALSLAAGKYVKLLCGDDILHPNCLERQRRSLEETANMDVPLAICGSEVINAKSKVVLRRRSRFRSGRQGGQVLIRKCVRWGTNLIGEPAVGMFRRELLTRSKGFDATNPYMIDLIFWTDLLKYGDAFVDKTRLASFRVSTGSVSAKTGFRQAAQFRRFVQKIHTDKIWKIKATDMALGYALSFQWCIFRNLLIKLSN